MKRASDIAWQALKYVCLRKSITFSFLWGGGGGGNIVARTDHIDMIKCRLDVEAWFTTIHICPLGNTCSTEIQQFSYTAPIEIFCKISCTQDRAFLAWEIWQMKKFHYMFFKSEHLISRLWTERTRSNNLVNYKMVRINNCNVANIVYLHISVWSCFVMLPHL